MLGGATPAAVLWEWLLHLEACLKQEFTEDIVF